VLVPVPFAVGLLVWVAVTVSSRYVSAGSIAAAVALVVARLLETRTPFAFPEWIVTAFCLVGAGLVIAKHRANVKRLMAGSENKVGDGSTRRTLLRGLHLCAVGLWCGAAVFFNFIAAVPIFDSFKEVVRNQPSDRTAFVRILPDDATDEEKAALASGLAGSAVGPLFPRLFLLSALCAVVAVPTANGFRQIDTARVHDVRFLLCCLAAVLVAAGWPLSDWVSRLRVERFHPDAEVAAAAKAAFVVWHLVSLASSGVTTLLVCVVLMLGAKLPTSGEPGPQGPRVGDETT
jgi:acyl phosphate:glycerol-3-phosphate acyltransferase